MNIKNLKEDNEARRATVTKITVKEMPHNDPVFKKLDKRFRLAQIPLLRHFIKDAGYILVRIETEK